MKPLVLRVAASVLAAGVSLFISSSAHATADASASISFTSLTISPNAGTFQLDSGLSPSWSSQPMFNGQNVGNSSMVSCSAYCSMDSSSGSTFNFYAPANSSIAIPGSITAYASGLGQSTVQGLFEITGGSGQVSVCFTVPYSGSLNVSTDSHGVSAMAETELSLTLSSISGNTTVILDNQSESIGANHSLSGTYSPSDENSVLLNYNQQYTFNLAEFAETMATNVPEPSTGAFLGIALLILLTAPRRAGRKSS